MSDARPPGEISAAYDGWAESYDHDRNATRDLARAVLRRHALALEGRTVLEIGCGTGGNLAWLLEHAGRVIGMDFSTGMLERARARFGDRVQLLRHDILEPWPLPDASVDLVIDSLVLEHVPRLRPVLRECERVLRPGGELLLCELHPTRQLHGRQAEFTSAETGELVRVPAFLHEASEFVNDAVETGFSLLHMGEWREEPTTLLPRLLSLHVRKPREGR